MMEADDSFPGAMKTATDGDTNYSISSAAARTGVNASSTNNVNNTGLGHEDDEPLRLPRIGGNRGGFLRDTIQSQLPTNELLQKRKQQAGRLFKSVGSQISKINLGKMIDQFEQDEGLANSLEQLNYRMKEEVERQGVRREAEELTFKVITDHLNEFLIENPLGTYEEWIQDLHPENARQGMFFNDIQQIDERFYVFESDHRRFWNEAVEKQQQQKNGDNANNNSDAHRLVQARTQIWGKSQSSSNPMVDLISGSVEFQASDDSAIDSTNDYSWSKNTTHSLPSDDADSFVGTSTNTGQEAIHNSSNEQIIKEENVSEDLIKF